MYRLLSFQSGNAVANFGEQRATVDDCRILLEFIETMHIPLLECGIYGFVKKSAEMQKRALVKKIQ